jgi:hypothetical protein
MQDRKKKILAPKQKQLLQTKEARRRKDFLRLAQDRPQISLLLD